MTSSISLKSLLLLVPFIAGAQAGVVPIARRAASNTLRLETTQVEAFAEPAPLVKTGNYASFKRSAGTTSSGARGAHIRNLYRQQEASGSGIGPLVEEMGQEYIMGINFQGTDVKVIVDTGSSDTWLVESDFQCLNSAGTKVDKKSCKFGTTYPGSFKKNNLGELQISYGDGEYCNGYFGKADITVAGITVPSVESALVNQAYWNGDSVTAGLMGLGYPGLTSDYVNGSRVSYDPIFTTMYKDGLSSAMFSMALEPGANGGYIAFGGLPPVKYDDNSWATTAIKRSSLSGRGTDFGFYAMTPDAFVYPGAPANQTDDYIVDSGTTLTYASTEVAAAIDALFSPPAQNGVVDCKAKAPTVGVKIGGKTFIFNPADLIFNAGNGQCISGIQGGGSPYILGDTFMKNVLVVFDVGAAQLKFATSKY